jgi:16S rRNA (guanine527-N7)-methyltransferase
MNPGETPVPGAIARRLNVLLAESGHAELSPEIAARFETYFELLLRWNARINLTAIRDEEGIIRRHFMESIGCARALPETIHTLLDFGSGSGLPGIPIALCRTGIAVTLAESQGKKAAFLREAGRVLGIGVRVHGARAETLAEAFDCVTLRAVDKMGEAIRAASNLVKPRGWLTPLSTRADSEKVQSLAGPRFEWQEPMLLPGGRERVLLLGRRVR